MLSYEYDSASGYGELIGIDYVGLFLFVRPGDDAVMEYVVTFEVALCVFRRVDAATSWPTPKN